MKYKIIKSFLFIGVFSITLCVFAQTNLPKIYIDKGACPFECCVYRNWTVKKDTPLFENPNGKRIIGKVKKGEIVKALTGEVHTKPQLFKVVFKYKEYRVGDELYILTYLGEGYNKVWFKGKIFNEDLFFIHNAAVEYTGCQNPSEKCWGKLMDQKNSVWWIQIQLKNGKKGWTKESQNFGNMDACG